MQAKGQTNHPMEGNAVGTPTKVSRKTTNASQAFSHNSGIHRQRNTRRTFLVTPKEHQEKHPGTAKEGNVIISETKRMQGTIPKSQGIQQHVC